MPPLIALTNPPTEPPKAAAEAAEPAAPTNDPMSSPAGPSNAVATAVSINVLGLLKTVSMLFPVLAIILLPPVKSCPNALLGSLKMSCKNPIIYFLYAI